MQCQAKAKSSGEQCRRRAVEGKGVCTVHGGLTPGGIASPRFKTGRYSKYIPKNLAKRYNEALSDPDLLSLNDDVALLRAIVTKHLTTVGEGDSNPAWLEAQVAYKELDLAIVSGDAEKLLAAKDKLREVIAPNYRATVAENQVSRYIDQVGRIADKERRLMIDRQQMIEVERVMIMITAVVMGLRESVLRYCDRETATRILSDVNTAYSRAVGIGQDRAVIDVRDGDG